LATTPVTRDYTAVASTKILAIGAHRAALSSQLCGGTAGALQNLHCLESETLSIQISRTLHTPRQKSSTDSQNVTRKDDVV
jgi:hypothetical protein